MRNYVAAGLAAVLMGTGVLIATAPPASAGCTDTAFPNQQALLCDGPILPDGVWQRCYGDYQCWLLGPGHVQPWDFFHPTPLNHIDDQPAAAPAATPPPPGAPAPLPPPPAPAPPHP